MRLRRLALDAGRRRWYSGGVRVHGRTRASSKLQLEQQLQRQQRKLSSPPSAGTAGKIEAQAAATSQKKPSTLLRVGLGATGLAAVGFGYVIYNPSIIGHVEGEDVKVLAEAVVRGMRLLSTVALMIADYKLAPLQDKSYALPKEAEVALDEAEKEIREAQNLYERVGIALENAETKAEKQALEAQAKEAREWVLAAARRLSRIEEHAKGLSKKGQIHQRAATRLLELCQANGGAYIKIGQHISQLDYLIPREYTETLRVLLNRAPVSDYEDVRAVVKEELGRYPEEIWARFDPTSIASASLAQVHVAYDKQGNKMAVKVQHRGLRETSRGDVAAMTFVINLVADLFPEFSYRWLAEEMAPQLPKELDFENEGRNAERAATFFRGRQDVVIPKVYWDQTGQRVLTMAFEEGCIATDVKELKRQGLALDKVARLISKVFSEQVYSSGWVHCDPHAANVLIRPHPKRPHEPVMILLDHGLYKQLDDDFRLDYCRLWKALVFKDLPAVKHYCQRLNSGEMYSLLAAILTNRSWDDIKDPSLGSLHAPNTKQEKTLIRTYAQKYIFEITDILNRVPRQMLLLLKTNDCLRHIDRELGSPINSSLIAAEECARALLREEVRKGPSWRHWTKQASAYWDFVMVKLRIQSFLTATRAVEWWRGKRPDEDEEGETVEDMVAFAAAKA